MLVWNDGDRNMTGLVDWLDVPGGKVDDAIAKFEAAAGVKGDWDLNDFGAYDWWGLHGTFHGEIFTVYTHKSGKLKIGGEGAPGDPGNLDVAGLKAALLALLT